LYRRSPDAIVESMSEPGGPGWLLAANPRARFDRNVDGGAFVSREPSVRCPSDHDQMRTRPPRSWPAQERLWSPVLVALFAVVAAAAGIMISEGHPLGLAALGGFVAAAMSAGERAVAPLDGFDKRYAASRFVFDRLMRRSRQQKRLRRAAPRVRRLARLSLKASAITLTVAIGIAFALSAAGARAPGPHPPVWMLSLHVAGYAIGYASLVAVSATVVLHGAIREWDQWDASPRRDLPVITTRELFSRLSGPRQFAALIWLTFALSVVALCFN
jgi:hypothetical protein